jgi:hypothetical protein
MLKYARKENVFLLLIDCLLPAFLFWKASIQLINH